MNVEDVFRNFGPKIPIQDDASISTFGTLVKATSRFTDDVSRCINGNADFLKRFRDFVNFKRPFSTNKLYGRKDINLRYEGWHAYHFSDNNVLIYQADKRQLKLLTIVDSAVTSELADWRTLVNYIERVAECGFSSYTLPTINNDIEDVAMEISEEQVADLKERFSALFDDMKMRHIVETASQGNLRDFAMWARSVIAEKSGKLDGAIATAMGGRQAIIALAKEIILIKKPKRPRGRPKASSIINDTNKLHSATDRTEPKIDRVTRESERDIAKFWAKWDRMNSGR